jgi:hypothetical protein
MKLALSFLIVFTLVPWLSGCSSANRPAPGNPSPIATRTTTTETATSGTVTGPSSITKTPVTTPKTATGPSPITKTPLTTPKTAPMSSTARPTPKPARTPVVTVAVREGRNLALAACRTWKLSEAQDSASGSGTRKNAARTAARAAALDPRWNSLRNLMSFVASLPNTGNIPPVVAHAQRDQATLAAICETLGVHLIP